MEEQASVINGILVVTRDGTEQDRVTERADQEARGHEPERRDLDVPQHPTRMIRDGHFYQTDLQTRGALAVVKAVDPSAAAALFERWRTEGRIQPDLAADQRHGMGRTQRHRALDRGIFAGRVLMHPDRVREVTGMHVRQAVDRGLVTFAERIGERPAYRVTATLTQIHGADHASEPRPGHRR